MPTVSAMARPARNADGADLRALGFKGLTGDIVQSQRKRRKGDRSMGAWEILEESSQVAAVHAALMPNGEVVYYSGNTGQAIPAATRIWNPITREVREPPNAPETDVFCSGLTPLWDGRLLVVGGTTLYPTDTNPFIGSKAAYVLEPEGGWARLPDMIFGRWYPSAIMLADGRVLVVSGASDDGGVTPRVEIYNQLSGWELLPESAQRLLPLYPRLHVLPTGDVACLGNGQDLIFFNPDTQEWHDLGAAGAIPHGDDDLAVLLAPAQAAKILHAGGGGADPDGNRAIATAQIIDLNDPNPAWRELAPMSNPRWFPNSALLPDGTLFVVGGGRGNNSDAVLEPEIFDPATETWTAEAPMTVPRLYHSTALLLPDGRVWVAGTDGETRMEVYRPDYLSRGARPVITDAPASVTYGQDFSAALGDGAEVSSVVFIRLSAVTHAFNMAQRSVTLAFTQADPAQVQMTAPTDANLAPPGHYMLFVLDGAGVPAVAPIIQLVAV
jgi:hypothetical protein